MSENMPKVIQSIVNNSFFDVDQLKEECRKLVEATTFKNNKLEIDISPSKVLDSFKSCEKEFIG
jgi:hypothetical protein